MNDDLIVQGSLAIGIDAQNGENFGFETLRLKENNLRIHFEDTSTSAAFPSTDWRIIVNDSANGGENYFSIENATQEVVPFRINDGSPASSLVLGANGGVGFGVDDPQTGIHLLEGDTPTLRLDQDNSLGWTPQTWDLGGNESVFFLRDVTHQTLPFLIYPNAPNTSLVVGEGGKVGIGTKFPSGQLHVENGRVGVAPSADSDDFVIEADSNAGLSIITPADKLGTVLFGDPQNEVAGGLVYTRNAGDHLKILVGGSEHIAFHEDGSIVTAAGASLSAGGAWTDASSRILKTEITDLSSSKAVTALRELKPVEYYYKADPSEHKVGFIAEEVPDLVATNDRKGLSPMDIIAVLTKVVQEQQRQSELQQEAIDELKGQLHELRMMNGSLSN